MLSASKVGQIGTIISTGVAGQIATAEFHVPDPSQVQNVGQMIIQAIVALVTIWATIRKARQQPVKVIPANPEDVQA